MLQRALGYAGHKTASDIPPPSLKPGETLTSCATKFSCLAETIPNNQEPTKLNFASTEHESYNNVKSGDYFVPDKRGVSVAFLDAATPSKAFYGTTIAATEITAGTWDVQGFLTFSDDQIREVFDRFKDNEGLVDARKSKAIMQGVYNSPTPPRWIADKFRGWFCRYGSRPDGMCDWPEFLKAVHAVRQSCSLDASTKPVGFPQWIKDSKKIPRRVVTVMDTQSSYQYEINAPNDKPLTRPYTFKTTMAGTTTDLQCGTTKHTYKLAGYGGAIPNSLRHENVRRHAEGRVPHPPRSDLLLTYHTSLPGYCGYFPQYSATSTKPRDLSNCPLTSQGAAALGLML